MEGLGCRRCRTQTHRSIDAKPDLRRLGGRVQTPKNHLLLPVGAEDAARGWRRGGSEDLRAGEDRPAELGLWGWQTAGDAVGVGVRWHWGEGTAEALALQTLGHRKQRSIHHWLSDPHHPHHPHPEWLQADVPYMVWVCSWY